MAGEVKLQNLRPVQRAEVSAMALRDWLRGALPAGAVQAGMMARDKTSPAKGRGTARKGGGGVRSDDRVLS